MSVEVDHSEHCHSSLPSVRARCERVREQAARAVAADLFDAPDLGLTVHVHLITPTMYLAAVVDEDDEDLSTCVITVEGNRWERMSILAQWMNVDGQLREFRTEASDSTG